MFHNDFVRAIYNDNVIKHKKWRHTSKPDTFFLVSSIPCFEFTCLTTIVDFLASCTSWQSNSNRASTFIAVPEQRLSVRMDKELHFGKPDHFLGYFKNKTKNISGYFNQMVKLNKIKCISRFFCTWTLIWVQKRFCQTLL